MLWNFQFCLGIISNGFSVTESIDVSLKWKYVSFFVDYNSIDKSHILNIHKYLTNENKIMFSLIKKVLAKAFDRTKFVSVNDEPW